MRYASLLETRSNCWPGGLKESLRPTLCALVIEMVSVKRLEAVEDSRRHQLHPKTRRYGFCVSYFCSDKRHHGQYHTLSLGEMGQETHCVGAFIHDQVLVDAPIIGNRGDSLLR